MRTLLLRLGFVLASVAGPTLARADYEFTTIAGTPGQSGSRDGIGRAALFADPQLLTVDPNGNVFVVDAHAIRRITPDGAVSLFAGSLSEAGAVDGKGAAARFTDIRSITCDSTGNLFVVEGQAVRKIAPDGAVSLFAGDVMYSGREDGVGAEARFRWPRCIAAGPDGSVYVSDAGNSLVRRISAAGVVSTWAGGNRRGYQGDPFDGVGTEAELWSISGIAVDSFGNVYFGDSALIRRISPDRRVTTVAGRPREFFARDGHGAGAAFSSTDYLAVDRAGNLLLASQDCTLRQMTPEGEVTTIAGQQGVSGTDDGVGGAARLNWTFSIAANAAGQVVLADRTNYVIRKGVQVAATSCPIFLVMPERGSRYVGVGSEVVLAAPVSAKTPVQFEWRRDGVLVASTQESSLTWHSVTRADAGHYSVTATNEGGSETLQWGTLTVYQPPVTSFTTCHANPNGMFLWGIAAGNGRIVAVGTEGRILASTDGEFWDAVDSGATDWLVGVAFGAGKFVAVGDHGRVITSTDARHWTTRSAPTAERLNNIVYGGGLFVAVGEHGTILTSDNGDAWTQRASSVTGWLRGVACNPNFGTPFTWMEMPTTLPRFLACGEGGVILGSADGSEWSRVPSHDSVSDDLEAMVAKVGLSSFAAIGANGTVVAGTQLWLLAMVPQLEWSRASRPSHARLRGLSVGANALFASGEGGEVWSAPDPAGPWARLSSGVTANLVAGTFIGNTLFLVGEHETIIRSKPMYASRLANISSRAAAGTGDATLISGFVIRGEGPKQMLLRAVGPGLATRFGMTGTAHSPTLTLFDSQGRGINTNHGWETATSRAAITEAASRVGAFPLAAGDVDSALLVTLDPGLYSAQATFENGSPGVCLIEAYDADLADKSVARAINISTRARVGKGDDLLIAGFVVSGESARRVLLRAAGPALGAMGVKDTLAHPRLNLMMAPSWSLRSDGSWSKSPDREEIRDAAQRVGAFAFAEGSDDAAMVVTVMPGTYSVHLSGEDETTGVAMVEVYDLP